MPRFAWALFACFLLFGCADRLPPLPDRPVPTGFLTDYSGLTPSGNPETPGAWVYKNRGKNLALYKIVILDPVQVKLKQGSGASALPDQDLQTLAMILEQEIRTALTPTYPIVTKPDHGVARIRAALTDVSPNFPNLRGVTSSTPITGMMGIEVEILDSLTGEQLAAAVETRNGRMGLLGNGFKDYGYARDTIHQWAFLLLDALNEAKGLHRGSELTGTGNRWR